MEIESKIFQQQILIASLLCLISFHTIFATLNDCSVKMLIERRFLQHILRHSNSYTNII